MTGKDKVICMDPVVEGVIITRHARRQLEGKGHELSKG